MADEAHRRRGLFGLALLVLGGTIAACHPGQSAQDPPAAKPQAPRLNTAEICVKEYLLKQAASDRSLGIAAPDAERLVREIVSKTGVTLNPTIIPCDQAEKAEAHVIEDDILDAKGVILVRAGEYIIYNPRWVQEVIGSDKALAVALYGHELGHLMDHDFTADRKTLSVLQRERDADRFAGCAVAREGYDITAVNGLFERLRDEKESDHPSRFTSLQELQAGFERCGGVAVLSCRLPENGVEGWGDEKTERQTSNWRGGGGSQERYCDEAASAIRARNEEHVWLDVVSSGEQTQDACSPFRCIQYQYYCDIKIRRQPIYNLAKSEKCPRPTG